MTYDYIDDKNAPRPIALVSLKVEKGMNLGPFSVKSPTIFDAEVAIYETPTCSGVASFGLNDPKLTVGHLLNKLYQENVII